MRRTVIPALLACLAFASTLHAQAAPWRFRWQANQTLTYRVEQSTTIEEVVGDRSTRVVTKLQLVKRWQVKEVDAAGVATLQLTLASMRNEITRPSGEVLLFDSTMPDKSTPELREQLGPYVGNVLAALRVDATGKVVEVKESKFGPASRYESDPPFKLVLGDVTMPGVPWTRGYKITLEPPVGTGETYDATQEYSVKSVADGAATITLTTAIVKVPETLLDQVPLLQSQPTGEVVFDTTTGLMKSASLRVDRELKGHQGEGSRYRFQSDYREERVADR